MKSFLSVTENVSHLASKGKRLDNRGLTDYRGPITVETGVAKSAEGSARVQIGDTVVMAGVKMSLEKPYNDSPNEGGIMINVELVPMSSPEYEPGPPTMKAVEIARVTDRGIREAKAIDFKKLCVKEGELVWFISVDIVSINDSGNLFDAASMAAIAALKDTTFRPFNEKTGIVDYKGKTDQQLPILKEPLSVTVLKVNGSLMIDPLKAEEEACDSRLTIASDVKGTISAMQKGGDHTLTIDEVSTIVDIALEKAKFLREKLNTGIN